MITQCRRRPIVQILQKIFLSIALTGFALWMVLGCKSSQSVVSQKEYAWQITGNLSERYQQYLVPAVFTALANDLINRANLREGDRILDVACGPGVVARLASQIVGETGAITGFDISHEMLDIARALPSLPGPVIDWREGDAMSLPFPSDTFHKVLCQQGLQFFPDQAKALQEMHRVLVPNGRVAVSVWYSLDKNPYLSALARAVS
jgi:ubiquinone/menaquinone biosynthesis C-methylase UbiE